MSNTFHNLNSIGGSDGDTQSDDDNEDRRNNNRNEPSVDEVVDLNRVVKHTATTCKQDYKLHRKKRDIFNNQCFHPRKYWNGGSKRKYDLSDYEMVEEGVAFLEQQVVIQPTCMCITQNRTILSCSCFSIFKRVDISKPNVVTVAVARYMLKYVKSTYMEQQIALMKWVRQGRATQAELDTRRLGLYFTMPVFYDDEQDEDLLPLEFRDRKICKHSLLCILGRRRAFWDVCMRAVDKNVIPLHCNVGRPSQQARTFAKKVQDAILLFFDSVHELAVRNEETGVEELPHTWTKQLLYERFSYDRGWTIKWIGHQRSDKVERTDPGHEQGSALMYISFNRFKEIWNRAYPNLIFQERPKKVYVSKKKRKKGASADTNEGNTDDGVESTASENAREKESGEKLPYSAIVKDDVRRKSHPNPRKRGRKKKSRTESAKDGVDNEDDDCVVIEVDGQQAATAPLAPPYYGYPYYPPNYGGPPPPDHSGTAPYQQQQAPNPDDAAALGQAQALAAADPGVPALVQALAPTPAVPNQVQSNNDNNNAAAAAMYAYYGQQMMAAIFAQQQQSQNGYNALPMSSTAAGASGESHNYHVAAAAGFTQDTPSLAALKEHKKAGRSSLESTPGKATVAATGARSYETRAAAAARATVDTSNDTTAAAAKASAKNPQSASALASSAHNKSSAEVDYNGGWVCF